MTEVNELQEEFSSIDELGQKPQQEEVAQVESQEEDLPEKYKGKSAKEIARMHQEAEKLIGRHSQEVSELRKLTDQILQQQLAAQKVEPSPEVDFFEDPKTAVRKTLEESPEFKEVQNLRTELKRQETVKVLNEKHGDWMNIAGSSEFADWIKASKARIDLYVKAEQFDVDAADELLTNFKLQKGVKSQGEEKRQQQLKSAGVETSGSNNGTSRKIFRRADLIRLAKQDPKRYAQMNDEITRAYQEGRVK